MPPAVSRAPPPLRAPQKHNMKWMRLAKALTGGVFKPVTFVGRRRKAEALFISRWRMPTLGTDL